MSKTSLNTTVEWRSINWRKLERRVYKLQKRIYQASQRGDVKALRRLQKTLMNSWSARALSVRRVTQDNTGKKTAGVDGIKSLSPAARLKLVNNLKLGSKVSPTRRVWIPKPGTEEKRPLGIPTMKDRAMPRARQDGTLSLNGKRDLNPTVMDSEPEGHVMMQLKQYLTRLGIKPDMC
jgi:RNA-directed DNA polymerase